VARALAETREQAAVEHRNEVLLVGRLAATPTSRELPSGDVLVQFRVVVTREQAPAAGRRAPTVDTLECSAWRKGPQRSLSTCQPGDVLEVEGALRRRFWRAAGGAASRSEVEALRVRRVRRASASDA
jgi:single-strand DNA-binding protein